MNAKKEWRLRMLEYFADPHPDELLYSVWARIGDQVKYPNQGDLTQELFGSRSTRALIDWSCSLGYLVRRLPEGHCYTVDTLIDNHTLFPLFASFLPEERRHLLRKQMIDGNGDALYARMGMLTSHIPRYEWLRYCPECVKSDWERFGETYWHRLHQAPGVVVCPMHSTFLEDSTVARHSEQRIFISAQSAIHLESPRSAISSPLYRLLVDIAYAIDELLRCSYDSPGPLFLRNQYLALLDQHNLVTLKGSLRVFEFLNALSDHYSPLLLSLLHCEPNTTRHIEASWATRLPFARRPQHPLHHILLIGFLGTTIGSFLSSSFQAPSPFGSSPWPCLNPVCERYHMLCIASYSTREKSPKDRPIGLFACPHCGFTYSRAGPDQSSEDIYRRDRIPFYGQLWQMKLREFWLDPTISTERIARLLGVDFMTVTQQAKKLALPSRRVSHTKSQQYHNEKDLQRYREEWSRLVEEHLADGITAMIRQIKSARNTYAWLNKYDREWLLSHRPPKKKPQRQKAHVNSAFHSTKQVSEKSKREERDEITSQALRSTATQILESIEEPRRVTRAELERIAPHLGWLLSRPNDFPKTVQAFHEVRETRESFALRRIQWVLQRFQKESVQPTRKEFIIEAKAQKVLDIPSVQAAIEEALAEFTCNSTCR